jgi:uncharacterized protein YbcC (UPF0753/DUF2309 family)
MSFEIKASHYVIGATALVAAFSFNTAVRELINKCVPIPEHEVIASFIYALVVTTILILMIEFLPNTKDELPREVQEKMDDAEERERLKERVTRLELALRRAPIQLRSAQT